MRSIVLLICLSLLTVQANARGFLTKALIGGGAVYGLYQLHKAAEPKAQLYCNGNDHTQHIFKNNDHQFLDSSGRPVPCETPVTQQAPQQHQLQRSN